jgi:hypothetical protein
MLSRGDTRLWVYERNSTRIFRNTPRNLASKRNYYTITRRDGTKDDKFEELLDKEVERPGIPVIRKLSSGSKQLKWEEIGFGATLIAMQELRVPFVREQLESMLVGIGEQVMNSALSIPGYLEHTIKKLPNLTHAQKNISADELRESVRSGKIKLGVNPEGSLWALGNMFPMLVNFYSAMKWTILISTDQDFVTSDCPVCRRYPETSQLGAGIANPDLEVYFPIAHDRLLLLRHDHAKIAKFAQLEKKGRMREAERLRDRTPEIAYQHVNKAVADEINGLIIERAYRWVYSPAEIDYVPKLFVGKSTNVRIRVDFIDGPDLIRIKHQLG